MVLRCFVLFKVWYAGDSNMASTTGNKYRHLSLVLNKLTFPHFQGSFVKNGTKLDIP